MIKRFLIAAVCIGFGIPAVTQPANARIWLDKKEYKHETDRFTGSESYNAGFSKRDCKMTKALRGYLAGCSAYGVGDMTVINFTKTNEGWDLLGFSDQNSPAIVTYKDGRTWKAQIPTKLTTRTTYGGWVMESVSIYIRPSNIKDIEDVEKIEFQFHTAEFEIKPTKELLCVVKRAKTC